MKSIRSHGWLFLIFAVSCQHRSMPHGEAGLLVHPAMEALLVETGLSYDGTISDLVRVTQENWLRKGANSLTPVAPQSTKTYSKKKLMPLFAQLGLVEPRPLLNAAGEKRHGVAMEDCLLAGGYLFTMADRLQFLQTPCGPRRGSRFGSDS